jgi:hypothetical protein
MDWLVDQGASFFSQELSKHAAAGGHIEVLEWLVRKGADLKAVDKNGWTVLHLAAGGGHVAAMDWLAGKGLADQEGKVSFDQRAHLGILDKVGRTELHLAAGGGHVEAMEWLVGQGVDLGAVDQDGLSALHLAACEGHMAAAEWLEKHVRTGATLDAFTKFQHKTTDDIQPVIWRLLLMRDDVGRKLRQAERQFTTAYSDIQRAYSAQLDAAGLAGPADHHAGFDMVWQDQLMITKAELMKAAKAVADVLGKLPADRDALALKAKIDWAISLLLAQHEEAVSLLAGEEGAGAGKKKKKKRKKKKKGKKGKQKDEKELRGVILEAEEEVSSGGQLDKAVLKQLAEGVLRMARELEFAGPFVDPVTEEMAPGYTDIIEQPMVLSTILTKLQSGDYVHANAVCADFALIHANCKMYNGEYGEMYDAEWSKKVENYGVTMVHEVINNSSSSSSSFLSSSSSSSSRGDAANASRSRSGGGDGGGGGGGLPPQLIRQLCTSFDMLLLEEVAEPFLFPVTDDMVPGYSDIVGYDVSDLGTMRNRLGGQLLVEYSCLSAIRADFELIYQNCITYNDADADIIVWAKRVRKMGFDMLDPLESQYPDAVPPPAAAAKAMAEPVAAFYKYYRAQVRSVHAFVILPRFYKLCSTAPRAWTTHSQRSGQLMPVLLMPVLLIPVQLYGMMRRRVWRW